ncbi:uncharacterized protein F5891DRAFT_1211111 [Suillus fuscotomentosus]|uniref:Uncharacterized protein n=1 Tax=Suillus fuscotomentosus TaxID=1912939 RepID=A0AAD4HCI0_9AGAM|nr:uncharacterized protein F5891DRAFT_1211111 [Suillus fuscotomentosus]KAG1891660.1 hypothetical protein F5891DRAFT_1211111 [Suillus fuscotomentosus]
MRATSTCAYILDQSTASGNAPRPKGKRAMDSFLEEIKRQQAMREARYSYSSYGRSTVLHFNYEGQSGSKDSGDPEVRVNTFAFLRFQMVSFADFQPFVANLPSNVTEQSLGYSPQIDDIQVDFPVQVSNHRPIDETRDGQELVLMSGSHW